MVNTKAPIRAGLLGIGNSANTFQIPFILAQPDIFKLHSVYERRATPEKSKARDLYGHVGIKVYTTLEETVTDPDVDLIVVAVKGPQHFEFAKAALEAGKHVILEKPVTATSQEVRDLIKIAQEKGVIFAPYHNRRFDGDFLTVKSLIEQGKLENLIDFESRYDTKASWGHSPAPGGTAGIIYGLGSHIIDQTVALFGEPSEVTALLDNARKLGHPDVDDTFTVHLRYPNNPVVVTLRSALYSALTKNVRFIVRGMNSSFVKYGLDPQEPQIQSGVKPLDPGFGDDPEELYGEYAYVGKDGKIVGEKVKTVTGNYLGYYRNVGNAILGKGKLEVTPEHAELGIRIIEVAKKSHEQKRTLKIDGTPA